MRSCTSSHTLHPPFPTVKSKSGVLLFSFPSEKQAAFLTDGHKIYCLVSVFVFAAQVVVPSALWLCTFDNCVLCLGCLDHWIESNSVFLSPSQQTTAHTSRTLLLPRRTAGRAASPRSLPASCTALRRLVKPPIRPTTSTTTSSEPTLPPTARAACCSLPSSAL